jgi:hypothetical protein
MMQRAHISVAVMCAALLLACTATFGMLLAFSDNADARSRHKKVIKNFENRSPILIPSGGPASPHPSEINVSGFRKGVVKDVNIILYGFSHGVPDDVDVLLVHRGIDRTIMSDAGGTTDAPNVNVILDDEAGVTLPDADPINISNAWRPANYANDNGTFNDFFASPAPNPPNGQANLSGFDGTDPNGTWSLYIDDDVSSVGGSFQGGWLLQITARVPR